MLYAYCEGEEPCSGVAYPVLSVEHRMHPMTGPADGVRPSDGSVRVSTDGVKPVHGDTMH